MSELATGIIMYLGMLKTIRICLWLLCIPYFLEQEYLNLLSHKIDMEPNNHPFYTESILLRCSSKSGGSSESLPFAKGFQITPSSLAPFKAPASLNLHSLDSMLICQLCLRIQPMGLDMFFETSRV